MKELLIGILLLLTGDVERIGDLFKSCVNLLYGIE